MVYRIYVEKKQGLTAEADALRNDIVNLLGIKGLTGLRLLNRYDAEQLDKDSLHRRMQIQQRLETYRDEVKTAHLDGEDAFVCIKEKFAAETQQREQMIESTDQMLNYAFDFMEKTFGDSQEMVIFLTELNTDYYAVWYVDQNGCDRYYQYNKSLLFSERQKGIMQELNEIEEMIE